MSINHPYQPDLVSKVSNYRQCCLNCPYDDCGASVRHPSNTFELHPSINNFIVVTCLQCNRRWFICMICEGQQMTLLSEKSASKHIFNQHRRTSKTKRKHPPTSSLQCSPSITSSPFNLFFHSLSKSFSCLTTSELHHRQQ